MAILLLAAWEVPRITEGWFRDRLLHTLEAGLGRKVEIGQVRFRIFPTPGFAISDVRIGEDPAIGAEPAAYVDTLVAWPAVLSLMTGKFVIGSVRLEDANLNLTRVDTPDGVRWNFASLASGTTPSSAAFPAVHMSGGRINFKFGDAKSIFYLLDTDVDLSPPSTPGGNLQIRIGGQPARTDRPSRGFGSFVARGQWNTSGRSLELDVRLEKSELSDVLGLFEGRESTLLGNVWGDAHLAGPITKIGVTGHLNIADLHGWNQLPPGGYEWPFTIGGSIDAAGQVIELAASGAGKQSPIGFRYRVADYLGRPRWAATVRLDGVPVAPLTGIARNFGIALPADVTIDGAAQGSIGYSASSGTAGMEGQVRVRDATLAAKGSPPLKIAQADIRFDGSAIRLSPTPIVNDAGESAAIDGSYDTATGEMHVALTSDGMAIASLRRQTSVAGAPIIGLATSGVWSGSLHYASAPRSQTTDPSEATTAGPDEGWTGDIHLKDTDIPFEAFARPIHIVEADASIDSAGAVVKRMQLTLGGVSVSGEYRYETGTSHPHRFRVVMPAASGEDLEALLMPALRRAGFLQYAFNFGRVPEPDWLRNMHAEGSIQAASLTLAGTQVTNLRGTVVWDGAEVNLTSLTGRTYDATFAGGLVIHLAARQPRYELRGNLSGFPWRSGTLDASGVVQTSGLGADLLANMRATGTFHGKRLEITPLDPWETVEGGFDLVWARTSPKLRLSPLTIQSGANKWTGVAETQDGGEMVLKVADGPRRLEATGALFRGENLKLQQ